METINNFTFIVIGKNEGWKIIKCIDSIYNTFKLFKLPEPEIIYIDSKSTDDSIHRVLKFPEVKIFEIRGKCNAAVARNIGAKESENEILFFLDGDMEMMPEFMAEVVNLFKKDIHYLSGQIIEWFYNEKWEKIDSRMVFATDKLNHFDVTNGGAFVIHKTLWNSNGGMKTKYDRSQDLDFIYRLIKKGVFIFRSEKPFVIHHTIQYNYKTTLKTELGNFRRQLFKGMLLREHLFNPALIKRNIRINYSLFLLVFSLIYYALTFNPLAFIPYLILIIYRSFRQYSRIREIAKTNYLIILFKSIYLDICAIVGFLVFYPKNVELDYRKLQ